VRAADGPAAFWRGQRAGDAGASARWGSAAALSPQLRCDTRVRSVLSPLPTQEPLAALPPCLRRAQAAALLSGQPGAAARAGHAIGVTSTADPRSLSMTWPHRLRIRRTAAALYGLFAVGLLLSTTAARSQEKATERIYINRLTRLVDPKPL